VWPLHGKQLICFNIISWLSVNIAERVGVQWLGMLVLSALKIAMPTYHSSFIGITAPPMFNKWPALSLSGYFLLNSFATHHYLYVKCTVRLLVYQYF
jgi:hypothetical protein